MESLESMAKEFRVKISNAQKEIDKFQKLIKSGDADIILNASNRIKYHQANIKRWKNLI